MKKNFTYIIILFVISISFNMAKAQIKEVTVSSGDSLIVDMEGHRNGNITWQRAGNLTVAPWLALSESKDSETLRYRVTNPYYIRSSVTDGTCDPDISDTIKIILKGNQYSIRGGRFYVEPTTGGISNSESGNLRNWTNQDKKAVWYLYQKAGRYEVSFRMSGTANRTYDFLMKTSACFESVSYEPQDFDFTWTPTSTAIDTLKAFTVSIGTTGYYRYELNANSSMSGLAIQELLFRGYRDPGMPSDQGVQTTDYLSSPSVHLNFSSTGGNSSGNYDYLYEEILVPEGYDPIYSYYMSIGFSTGYLGIQTNTNSERRVLFSVWDAEDRDNGKVDSELCVELVDKASYTTSNGFGNEGTGGQSYVGAGDFNTWKTGTPVKFMLNYIRDGEAVYQGTSHPQHVGKTINYSIFSAWYDAGEGWRYIASWRVPRLQGSSIVLDGFHSFLENYGWSNGNLARKAYYYNCYGRNNGNKSWVHFNRASYSNTDGAVGQRVDYEQGVAPEDPTKFYMLSGGYGPTAKQAQNTVTYVPIENFEYLNTLDLKQFEDRVQEAIENYRGSDTSKNNN